MNTRPPEFANPTGVAFATDCHRLPTAGSIRAPSSRCLFWLRRSTQRHVDAPLADAQRVRVEVNALGDAVEDGHLEVGVQLLLAREELIEERVQFVPARRAIR
jgi:hypothetical protein